MQGEKRTDGTEETKVNSTCKQKTEPTETKKKAPHAEGNH